MKRAIVIVLDGVGVGELPDSHSYGDSGANSLVNTARAVGGLSLKNLRRFGLGNIANIEGMEPVDNAIASWGKMAEVSPGKDSISGHWELMGCPLSSPFPTYSKGFPEEIIKEFESAIGRNVLGNRPASGTEIIEELGAEHIRTGCPIVYTSADSVFQIAAHEDIIPVEELYRMCEIARSLLKYPNHVARVIARPFVGKPGSFKRTERRKDFSLEPPDKTLLDVLTDNGKKTVTIGKIHDLFSSRGISRVIVAKSNDRAMHETLEFVRGAEEYDFLFVNLIDFDMTWGHRRDFHSYARGLEQFDRWLDDFIPLLPEGTLFIISSDHGCDPTFKGSDHTREYVPLLAKIIGRDTGRALGVRESFSDVAATVAEHLGVDFHRGESFLSELVAGEGREI